MSPAQAKQRRKRLAKAERRRQRAAERDAAFQKALRLMRERQFREAEERRWGARNHWTRRLLRWLTGGYFG